MEDWSANDFTIVSTHQQQSFMKELERFRGEKINCQTPKWPNWQGKQTSSGRRTQNVETQNAMQHQRANPCPFLTSLFLTKNTLRGPIPTSARPRNLRPGGGLGSGAAGSGGWPRFSEKNGRLHRRRSLRVWRRSSHQATGNWPWQRQFRHLAW